MRLILSALLLLACSGEPPPTDDTDPVVDTGEEPDTDEPRDLRDDLDALLATLEPPVTALEPLPAEDADEVALGELLFWDPVLSGNKDIACATCHDPDHHTSDGLPLSLGTGATGRGPARAEGEHPAHLPRRAPPLWNRARLDALFWDARLAEPDDGPPRPPGGEDLDPLAVQALHPILDPREMLGQAGDTAADGSSNELAGRPAAEVYAALEARLAALPAYVDAFDTAYGQAPTMAGAARALAAYQRDRHDPTDTPWDRYLRGDRAALGESAVLGALFFYRGERCGGCHAGPLLTDGRVHNIGVPFVQQVDRGRQAITGEPDDAFAFRTPPLRMTALGGPYMHNGALADLGEVLRHYAAPQATMAPGGHLPDDLDFVGTGADLQALRETLSPDLPLPDSGASTIGLSNLRDFLEALTDEGEAARAAERPASVPSGLTVGGG